jgi:hypothetical protein
MNLTYQSTFKKSLKNVKLAEIMKGTLKVSFESLKSSQSIVMGVSPGTPSLF